MSPVEDFQALITGELIEHTRQVNEAVMALTVTGAVTGQGVKVTDTAPPDRPDLLSKSVDLTDEVPHPDILFVTGAMRAVICLHDGAHS